MCLKCVSGVSQVCVQKERASWLGVSQVCLRCISEWNVSRGQVGLTAQVGLKSVAGLSKGVPKVCLKCLSERRCGTRFVVKCLSGLSEVRRNMLLLYVFLGQVCFRCVSGVSQVCLEMSV